MSALRRLGYGPSDHLSYRRYYRPGGGDVPVHPPPPLYPFHPKPPQPPISWRVRGGGPAETTWLGEGGGGDGCYPSGGAWPEPGSHQSLNSYTNGAYGPTYPPGPGANTASYSGAYYAPGYTHTSYSTVVASTYLSGVYPQQDCQTEVAGYPASQNSGMTLPRYPYGDGNRSVPQSGQTVRPRENAWASPGAYGMGGSYPWPSSAPSAPPDNLYMTESTSPWPSSGSPQSPPTPPLQHTPPLQQPKDSSYPYSQSDQSMNRHNFPCSVHYAEPQLYGNATKCVPSDESTPPNIKKIIHVLEKVQYLEQEELLELDSVETGGQDSVRQARKEAVCKIQAIVEKLEKKDYERI
uniref:BAG domain-containing protein n=1 Tax=Pan paniscus TaxID=9597 RepID=A0A2R9A3G9_PANPA